MKGYKACLLFPVSRYFFFFFYWSSILETLNLESSFHQQDNIFSCNSKHFSRQMLWTSRLPDALNVLLIWIQLAVVFVYQALFVFVYQALFEVNRHGTKVRKKNHVKTPFSHHLNHHIWGKYANVVKMLHIFFFSPDLYLLLPIQIWK